MDRRQQNLIIYAMICIAVVSSVALFCIASIYDTKFTYEGKVLEAQKNKDDIEYSERIKKALERQMEQYEKRVD